MLHPRTRHDHDEALMTVSRRVLPAVLFLCAALAAPAAAQRLLVYQAGNASQFQELQPMLDIHPAAPALPTYTSPGLPAQGGFAGDCTFHHGTNLIWHTNGLEVAFRPSPTMPPAATPGPTIALSPAVLAAIGGVATGLAGFQATNGMLVAGANGVVVLTQPTAGTPILAQITLQGVAGPITGLDFDRSTMTIYAVNSAGVVYRCGMTGAQNAPPIVPPVTLWSPATDVVLDRTHRLNASGRRPVYVLLAGLVMDVNADGAGSPSGPLVGVSQLQQAQGIGFLDHPASNPASGGCACPGAGTTENATNGPMVAGNAAFALHLTGLAAAQFCVFAFDTTFDPAFPMINVVGCAIGLVPTSPTLILALAAADAQGVATLPLPLNVPAGAGPLYNQNFSFCASDPTGFVFSPLQRIQASAP